MSQVAFPITTFTQADGSPVANGSLLLSLNTDARASIGPDGPFPNMLVSSTGLVLNSYYTSETGRGDYFPGVSGTSESQFLLALGLLEAYQATSNATALSLANLCFSPIQSILYRGYPVPNPVEPTQIWAPHWLFDVAGPFVSATINYGPQLGGWENTFTFVNGVAIVPDPPEGEAHIFYQAMTPDYTLIYQSPYSPPLSGTAYPIASYVYTEGVGTTVTLEDTSVNASLQVIYSCLNGPLIVPNQVFEAFPDWRALGIGEIDSACDTYNWAYRAFTLAASITGNDTYTSMATATVQQAEVVYPVNNQRQWIAPSIQLQPLSQSGAFEYTDNTPAPVLSCNNAGSIVLTQDSTPTAGSTSQFGVASINDTFGADDTVTWNFEVNGTGSTQDIQLYIDTTNQNPYDPTNRYIYDFTATLGTAYNLTGLVLADFVNSDSTALAAGSAVYTCGVQIPGEMPEGLRVTINSVQAFPNITIMYENGCIPFTANFLSATGPTSASLIGWQGPSYSGYQSPWMFRTVYGDTAANVATNVQFLADAQTAWTNQSATQDSGPFAPCFYFDKPDSVEYGPVNTFGWNGPDPNTEWVGYQVRPLSELAELVLACDGSESYYSQAVTVTNTFLEWFDSTWTTAAVNAGPPSIFPQTGAEVTYPEPHAVALIARACLHMIQAGQSNDAYQSLITKAISFWTYWYTSTGTLAGTFANVSGIFGFWTGEILRTQSEMYTYYQESNPTLAAQLLVWINGAVDFVNRSVVSVSSYSQICAGRVTRIPLDSNGTIIGSPVFWPNDELQPSGTYYVYRVRSAAGQQVVGPSKVVLS